MTHLRALFIEDSESDAALVVRALTKAGYEVHPERVESAAGFRRALADQPWDVVIADYAAPGFGAAAALPVLKELGLDLPFLVVSGHIGEAAAAELMRAGAHDFVPKGDLARLGPAVHREVNEARLRRDRLLAIEELRRSAEQYRTILDTTQDGFFVLDARGRFLDANGAYCALTGYRRDELLKMSIRDVDPFETPEEAAARMRSVIAAGYARFEVRHLTRGGRYVDFDVSTTFVPAEGRSYAFLRDITRRKRHDADRERMVALLEMLNSPAEARELARSLVRFLQDWSGCEAVAFRLREGDGFPFFETGGFTLAFLSAAERMCPPRAGGDGRDGECLCAAVLSGDRHASLPCFTARGSFWRTGDPDESRGASKCRPGANRPCDAEGFQSMALVPLQLAGRRVGLMQLCDRRRDRFTAEFIGVMESAADAIATALEQRAAQAGLRKSEEMLRQAQKLESISRLAGGIAHDFNNLLTVINGYASLALKRLNQGDPLRLPLSEVRKAGEQAAALTSRLLAFSRQQVVDPRPVDCAGLLAEYREMFERLVGEDVRLTVHAEPTAAVVLADPAQLVQVLMNLVVNARDAMPDGGALTMATGLADVNPANGAAHPGVSPGEYVVVEVADTGTGIDSETRGRIFDPFFTTKPAGKGTGLGLSTAYGIVRQCGGYILVDSEPGRGARFIVYLPRAGGERPVSPAQTSLTPVNTGRPMAKATVLVADDSDAIRRIFSRILEDAGYTVVEAADGPQTRDRFRDASLALALIDLNMPGQEGLEAVRALHAERPEVRMVLMSAAFAGVSGDEARALGVDAVLGKPAAPELLIETLRRLLPTPPDYPTTGQIA